MSVSRIIAERKNGRRMRSGILGLSALLVGTLLLYGCEIIDPNPGPDPFNDVQVPGDTSGGNGEPPTDTIPPSTERGVTLFARYCASCHGDDAAGGLVWPGSIQGKTGIHTIVRDGRRGMPAITQLTDSEIESIELWLGSFNVDHSQKSDKELFEFYCASCHGADANGTNIFSGSIAGYAPIHPIVRNGTGDMDAIDIPDSTIAKIQRYLGSLQTVDFSTLSGEEYFAKVCASCHGTLGEGTSRGPEIRNPVTGYARHVIRNGRSGNSAFTRDMPKYTNDSLSDAQMNGIITWLRSAQKPSDGKSLYNRFCSTCHGFDAEGGPSDKDILGEDREEFYEKIREGHGDNKYGERTEYMPSWSRSELTDEEIAKIVAYVRSL